jgi:hypothetical protein
MVEGASINTTTTLSPPQQDTSGLSLSQQTVLIFIGSVVGLGLLLVAIWRLTVWCRNRRQPQEAPPQEAPREEVYRVPLPPPLIIQSRSQRVIVLDMAAPPEVF